MRPWAVLLLAAALARGASPAPVFQIKFEWGGSSHLGSYQGTAVAHYAPSTAWTGHIGVNHPKSPAKGFDESSPAALYRALGNLANLRPDDLLQFYVAGYSGTATVSNGCTFTDLQTDAPETYTAWIQRTPEGAELHFGTLEAADSNGQCSSYDVSFTREFDSAQSSALEDFFTFRLTNKELAGFQTIRKTNVCSLSAGAEDPGEVWGRATLTAELRPDELEVQVEPAKGYDTWLPEGNLKDPGKPGQSMKVTLKVRAKEDPSRPGKAFLFLSLPKVSQEKGLCLNWPNPGQDGEGLRFRQEDYPEGSPVLVDSRTQVHTSEAVEDLEVTLGCYDYGAWGTLRILAKDENGRELKVKVRGQESADLEIPLDDNHNHIADVWERGKVTTSDRFWDEDEVPGQDRKGDGITLYGEYRGLVVKENGSRTHRRLSPLRKEMFVLDPKEAFPRALWKDRTGIEVVTLEDDLVDASANPDGGPLVDFNASDRTEHPFYALRVQVIAGDTDPSPASDGAGHTQPATTTDPSAPLMAYASSSGSIKSADYIKVFPDRAALLVDHYLKWLDLGLKSPDSVPGQEVRDPKNLFTPDEALQALSLLGSPQARGALALKIRNVLFIHEVGHICGGLPDHEGNPPPGYKDAARACFMWNPSLWDRRRMIVLTALGRGDSSFAYAYSNFCRDLPVAGFHCYRMLNVKDW